MASPNRSALLANVFAMPVMLVDVAATLSTARAWEDSRYWRWRRSTECPSCDAAPSAANIPSRSFPPSDRQVGILAATAMYALDHHMEFPA
jgi:hypothetical protein